MYNNPDICMEKLVCQGVEGAYSGMAGAKFANLPMEFVPTFKAVFDSVGRGVLGVVPIENSTAGEIGEVHDLLLKNNLYILASYNLPIVHSLLGVGEAEQIRTVYSHPQALMQSSEYLAAHAIHSIEALNTAIAAKKVGEMRDVSIGAICNRDNADRYNLKVLVDNVNNYKSNHTKFVLLGERLVIPDSGGTVSLVFTTANRVGALGEVLDIFMKNNINLSKIQSRPHPEKEWEYVFHVDFEGNLKDKNITDALARLQGTLPLCKVLGNYIYIE